VAFFRISRSWRRISFSRRSRFPLRLGCHVLLPIFGRMVDLLLAAAAVATRQCEPDRQPRRTSRPAVRVESRGGSDLMGWTAPAPDSA
jgi:hypothetical protein